MPDYKTFTVLQIFSERVLLYTNICFRFASDFFFGVFPFICSHFSPYSRWQSLIRSPCVRQTSLCWVHTRVSPFFSVLFRTAGRRQWRNKRAVDYYRISRWTGSRTSEMADDNKSNWIRPVKDERESQTDRFCCPRLLFQRLPCTGRLSGSAGRSGRVRDTWSSLARDVLSRWPPCYCRSPDRLLSTVNGH